MRQKPVLPAGRASVLVRLRAGADAFERPGLWITALVLLALLVAFLDRSALSGDWYSSGNDMAFVLPALREAGPDQVRGWLTGPWVGEELFRYYRPVASLFWRLQFQNFGEETARWQAVSVALHAATTALLALLCRRCIGAALPALVAALLWATRDRTIWGLEWTPAQTDHLAGFFGVAALAAWASGLARHGGRRAALLAAAVLLATLAMGSKEVALTVPLLMAWLALWAPALSRRGRFLAAGGALALLMAFFLWRLRALGGVGFLPGQAATAGRQAASPTLFESLRTMGGFLLPGPIGPLGVLPMGIPWIAGAVFVAWRHLDDRRWRWGIAALGALGATILLEEPFLWLLSDTWIDLMRGLAALALVAWVARSASRESFLVAGWGALAFLPCYHVVYNRAGNVTYFPEIYWALGWTLLLRIIVSAAPSAPEAGDPPAHPKN